MHAGVLAIQGDVAEHLAVLRALKVAHSEVRTCTDLLQCTHLIIPGGESTVMAKFLWKSGLAKEIQKRVKAKSLSVYGTCAGAILVAKNVTGKNAPKPLGLIDITVERNAYGTQTESFDASVKLKGEKKAIAVSFIRAPKISRVGKSVQVLSSHGKEAVLVRQGNILAGTFHPEMRDDKTVHALFLKK